MLSPCYKKTTKKPDVASTSTLIYDTLLIYKLIYVGFSQKELMNLISFNIAFVWMMTSCRWYDVNMISECSVLKKLLWCSWHHIYLWHSYRKSSFSNDLQSACKVCMYWDVNFLISGKSSSQSAFHTRPSNELRTKFWKDFEREKVYGDLCGHSGWRRVVQGSRLSRYKLAHHLL